jgi:hypothetical protein
MHNIQYSTHYDLLLLVTFSVFETVDLYWQYINIKVYEVYRTARNTFGRFSGIHLSAFVASWARRMNPMPKLLKLKENRKMDH